MSSFITWGRPGTYLIHPDHMHVRYPSNTDDVDIAADSDFNRPFFGPPTQMTLMIAKIRGAEIMRDCTDVANKSDLELDEVDYSLIMAFDKKINDFCSSLPSYLRYDGTNQSHLQQWFKERPYLERQRSLLLSGLHNGLAQLHRRFLGRAYRDTRYSYSRTVCVRSTRIVLELQEAVRRSFVGQIWLVLQHVFVAATTLCMDYSYNRDNPPIASERKRDILRCFLILEESEEQYVEVKQGLEALKRTTQGLINGGKPGQRDTLSIERDAPVLPLSDTPLLRSQSRQVWTGATSRGPEWSSSARDSMYPWTTDSMTQTTSMNSANPDRLAWPTNVQSAWSIPGALPSPSHRTGAMDEMQRGSTLTAQQYSAEGGPWADTDPDPWLPGAHANTDGASEGQWEELFRNLDAQAFMTGF